MVMYELNIQFQQLSVIHDLSFTLTPIDILPNTLPARQVNVRIPYRGFIDRRRYKTAAGGIIGTIYRYTAIC